MNRIIVNGDEVDLFEGESVSLNIQLNTISDISTRNSSHSNTIKIPRTAKNSRLLGFLGINGNTSRFPYEKIRCSYTQNTIPIFNNGYLQVTNTSDDYYKIVLYDGVIDMKERLKGKKMSDLDMVQYQHILNTSQYTESFNNTEGYMYAFGNYGTQAPIDTIRIDYQVPVFFMHTLWDEIITQAGYTYEGDIFSETDFTNKLVTPSNGITVFDVGGIDTPLGNYNNGTIDEEFTEPNQTTRIYSLPFNENSSPNSGLTTNPFSVTVNYEGQLIIDMSTFHTIKNGEATVNILQNNENLLSVELDGVFSGTTEAYFIFNVSDGDEISANVEATSEYLNASNFKLDIEVENTIEFRKQTGGQIINPNDYYGDIDQDKFIKDIMQHYGLIVKPDSESHLRFKTIESILTDTDNAEDWSDKVILITNENYKISSYAQNNICKYKYESIETLFPHNGSFEVVNEYLDDEKTLFTSEFKMRKKEFDRFGRPIYSIPLWIETYDEDTGNLEEVTTGKTELSFFNYITSNETVNLKFLDSGSIVSYTGDIPILSNTDIKYQYFLDTYYTTFSALLSTYKELTVELNLNSLELHNLDFFRLKYLKQTGKYYYLNKVKTSSNGITKAELIEINEKPINNILR